jgi:hypothetical protein
VGVWHRAVCEPSADGPGFFAATRLRLNLLANEKHDLARYAAPIRVCLLANRFEQLGIDADTQYATAAVAGHVVFCNTRAPELQGTLEHNPFP